MRIWSLHPKYLDTKGLVALWRETLLAKKVLENNTRGYKNHPQLSRFKNTQNPVSAINAYLSEVYSEARRRDFKFDKSKIGFVHVHSQEKIAITRRQLQYEFEHLMGKLQLRDPNKLEQLLGMRIDQNKIESHPLFYVTEGPVENWERKK
jgi:hypothetical protein